MEYTMWENTPLKWHRLLTFLILPLGVVLNICQAIILLGNVQNWTGILIPLGCIDLVRFAGCSVLSVIAIIGCIPSRRRWYGPQCAVALYVVLSGFSVLNVILGIAIKFTSDFLIQNAVNAVCFLIVAALMTIYYRKRRRLFSGPKAGRPVAQKIPAELPAPVQTEPPEQEEPENSLELLAQIQAEAEKENEVKPVAKAAGKTAPVWVVTILGIVCVACIAACVLMWANTAGRISELEKENSQLEKNYSSLNGKYSRMKDNRDTLQERVDELEDQIGPMADRITEISSHSNFLMNYIGFVVEGSSYYHTFECSTFQSADTYWAHNIEYCEYLGYSPCPACH